MKLKYKVRLTLILIFSITLCPLISQSSLIPVSHPTKDLQLVDRTYEPNVKTVQLYPSFGARENELLPSVAAVGQSNLLLEFDVLNSDVERYYVRIIHCNHDWTKSDLADLDFMPVYNEFPITEYEFSNATQIPYIHYWFQVPPVKLAGNYVLVVYRDSSKDDLILTRRFMTYENQVTFTRDGNLIGAGQVANMNQQINFTINYKNIDILNPMMDVAVVIRQNYRWDNLITNIKPTFARENIKELEYRFFDVDKLFKGGNEFRFFDLRSIDYPGRNVESVNKTSEPMQAFIFKDKSHGGEAYSQYNDINGNFQIENLDYRDLSAANYLEVHFALASPKIDGDVYLQGAFTMWNYNDENKMTYNASAKEYQGTALLKQGWYDYQYVVQSKSLPPLYFEGSHFQTENVYEIFVYHRPFQPRADLLIGYALLRINER